MHFGRIQLENEVNKTTEYSVFGYWDVKAVEYDGQSPFKTFYPR